MASPSESVGLLSFPDDVLLHVLSNLNAVELWNLSQVCKRLQSIAFDRSLVRNTTFDGLYSLSDDIFRGYMRSACFSIETLNCDNCYWISSNLMSVIPRCKNLRSLSVIDCRISPKKLCQLISPLENLEKLSFSVLAIGNFCNEFKECEGARERFRRLKELVIHFKRGMRSIQENAISINVVQQTTFLEHCENLEKLSIIGAPHSFPKDLLRPLIENISCLSKVREIGINDGVDPAARLFFFGVLLQLCKLDLGYKTLLIPSANFARLQSKPEFKDCYKHSDEIQHLDVSRAETDFNAINSPVTPLQQSSNLLYLNIADNYKVDSNQLKIIAGCCPNLRSLNLQSCAHVLMNSESGQIDTSGMECLLEGCAGLTELNVSGIHVHSIDGPQPIQTLCLLLSALKGLQSLSLPACCLCTPDTESAVPTCSTLVGKKRVRVAYSAPRSFGKRRRVGVPVPSTSTAPEDDLSASKRTECSGELERLTVSSPDIRHFELIGAGFKSMFNSTLPINFRRHSYTACAEAHTVCDEELMAVSRWKDLTTLQLSGLPGLIHGNSLVTIARGCQGLTRLYLCFLGSVAHCSCQPALCKALGHMAALRDFRLEQPNVNLASLFEALEGCPRLERLCVISRNSSLQPQPIEALLQKVPSLVVVQLFTGSSAALSKKIQTALISRFSESRPALSISIFPAAHDDLPDNIRGIPTKHYDGLLLLNSSVAHRPKGW